MTVISSSLSPKNGLVTDQDAYRDRVSNLALDLPRDLVQRLRDEIIRTYRSGDSEEERRDIAHSTACPEMVADCEREWGIGSQSKPLTQLLALVADAMNQLFGSIDKERSYCPPQIAVRPSKDTVQYGPHVDGLIDGEKTEVPDVPFGIVGVYLDDVSKTKDGALVYWLEKAEAVREATATHAGKALTEALCSIGRTCDFSDPVARPVLGTAGHAYFVGGNVPHCNHSRSADGKRVAIYFRMYAGSAAS
ncbi:hypothetical protein ACNRBV_09495 [Ralstonia pseudosolanacearum]|uniref:hypothetical protein n=1 Tax=Ralstonia pseudosolanacearum TaxID=1310165 RepID=UPI0018A4D05D|nr:hypothetical protein [Ralstonia pseudosolanacearum]BCL93387.1 hypothetical protein MAFF211479_30880 [Ralstonia solanacearum]BCN05954.1 hypothetical protein RPSB_30910 [Ralstonia solanacearum]